MSTDFGSGVNDDKMECSVCTPLRKTILDLFLASTYRIPKSVTKIRIYRDKSAYAVCPRCNSIMEREYQLYCSHCGQHLEWSRFEEAEKEFIGWNDIEENENLL